MQRVIQVSLNRNPWSIEVDAHARLEVYLSESATALASDPDRDRKSTRLNSSHRT